nr:class I tRNA ligase family protein [Patescibacteria group bacterium]
MKNFKPVDTRRKYSEMEREQTEYWKKNKTFEKSVEQRSEDNLYSFYDGPPFATGAPHYGHIVGSTMKDVVPRYWTMKGFRVERCWGWDCHGLPIENIAEKDLGISNKKEIEEMGVEKFNEACRSKVLSYVEEWKKVVEKLGRWADMEDDYKTMDLEYMESVWWVFKQLYDKGLIYEGYRSMHICPRCETTLSQTEVSEGYKDVKDLSATAKFQLKYQEGKTGRGIGALILNDKDEILLIRRKEDGRRETWAMPGGKVDKNETFRQALEREIKEELGVDIESAEPIVHNPEFIEGRIFDTVCYLTKIKGEPKNLVPDETEKIKWFSLDKLPEIDYEPTENAINSYLADKTRRADEELGNELPRVYALAWTTTPWTLVGNVALAIGKNIKYSLVRYENDFYVLAKDRIEEVFKDKEYKIIIEVKGKELVGLNHEPLFDYYSSQENWENGWKIYAGDFVTTEEGTGIVHIAPAFGEDDMSLGKEKDLPFIQHVGMDGVIKKEAKEFAGMNVKPRSDEKDAHQKTDIEIIKYLAHNNLLFSKEKYEHSYPHCWRCDTPLINYATSSWFVAITKIKEKMLENAKDLNWEPGNIKEGRWGNWLEGARDWSISRQRYWASVMPIWKCECGETKVIGSVEELESLSGKEVKDLHKHVVDEITFPCEKCQKEMKRIPDVLDTWFDSGSMPYAQAHYPFENKEKFGKSFPAEFIAEGIDQTRAWFYYLHAIATGIFDQKAFKNVIVNGIVLAEDGKKMAKKLQNYPDPTEMMEKYGADILRFYLMYSPVVRAQNLNFSEKDLAEFSRGMFRMIQNSYSFFVLYANIDEW